MTYDYASVMAVCDIPNWESILKQINKKDIYVDLSESIKGLETEPHVTVLYGIHDDVPLEDIVNEVQKFPKIVVHYEAVDGFLDGEEYDVLKIAVSSSDLSKMNKRLSQKFDNTNDYPDYNPHITIAYLKKGTAKKYFNRNVSGELTCNKYKISTPEFGDRVVTVSK